MKARADPGFQEGGATQLRNSLPLGRSVAKRPRTAEGRAGGGYGRGSPPPAMGVRGYYPREIFLILLCCRWVLMLFKYKILEKSSSFVQINCSVFQQYRTNKTRLDHDLVRVSSPTLVLLVGLLCSASQHITWITITSGPTQNKLLFPAPMAFPPDRTQRGA